MTSFSIQSFGCRVNQAEAFQWADEFQKHGLKYEKDTHKSDLVLVNTCTLTGHADRDVRSFIRRVVRENPDAKLVVTGCYADRVPDDLEKVPQVWQVLSNQEKKELPKRVLSKIEAKQAVSSCPYRSRALIKIQDGCDYGCAFCVIPSVRGESISCQKEEILDQVRSLVARKFSEIVLTGIHISLYGRDLNPKSSLLALLKELEGFEKLGRIRLSSLDPRFIEQSLLEHLVSSHKVCPHFHLSLQHGSDSVLARMGRKIQVSDYQKILNFFQVHLPLASLGADIIVGFPGETKTDFDAMCRFLEQSPLTYFHVFSYSPRPDTPASTWKQVERKVKKERAAILRELSDEKNLAFRRRLIDKSFDAVVIRKENDKAWVLTGNYVEIAVPKCTVVETKLVRVKITHATPELTRGKVVS